MRRCDVNCLAHMVPGGAHVIAEAEQSRELESQAQARPMASSLHYEAIPVLEQTNRSVDIAIGARRVRPRNREALRYRRHTVMRLERCATTEQAFLPRKVNDRGRIPGQEHLPHALTKDVRLQSNEAGHAPASLPFVQGLPGDLILSVARLQARLRDVRRNELVDISQSVS